MLTGWSFAMPPRQAIEGTPRPASGGANTGHLSASLASALGPAPATAVAVMTRIKADQSIKG